MTYFLINLRQEWSSCEMKFLGMRKVRDGKYLKGYELEYLNKAGAEKTYEMVSFAELQNENELGQKVNGISIVAFMDEKMLLLREFRMGVNRCIYNLCAGMLEAGETIEECIARELYEETGLKLERIIKILPPSFAAVSISDVKNQIAFVEVSGELSDHTSPNEEIEPQFYTKGEMTRLLEQEAFSTRAQLAGYFFTQNLI